jgi:Ca2+-dependent lipid-binding protein
LLISSPTTPDFSAHPPHHIRETTTSFIMAAVSVQIVEARGILAADSNGFSDAFVTMTLLDSRGNTIAAGGAFKTKIIKKSITPVWNESFVIGDKLDLRLATTLRLLVADSDGMFAKDDPLGVVDIPVSLFAGNRAAPVRERMESTLM